MTFELQRLHPRRLTSLWSSVKWNKMTRHLYSVSLLNHELHIILGWASTWYAFHDGPAYLLVDVLP